MSALDNVLNAVLTDEAMADQAALASGPEAPAPTPAGPGFAELGLSEVLLKALGEAGYVQPTPVQARAIPQVLAGIDLMVSSQTGSGKTAAFMLPALQKLAGPAAAPGAGPRVLVLTPTRELAQQVTRATEVYGRNLRRLNTVSILGGIAYGVQIRLLKRPVDVLVATPGRLIDHMQSGRIDFSRLELLVLDEADRMLDMGFIEDIEKIVAETPATRQTLLFSATLDGVVGRLAARMMRTPLRIEISSSKDRHANIEQRLHFTDDLAHKGRLLDHLLRDVELKQAIVFTATKRDADQLAQDLNIRGFAAAALHGDMNQRQRTRTLQALHRGGLRILVATDVAARGIDVQGVSHVINFDLPMQPEDYVHRIGRTGRAGKSGIAISFASGKEFGQVKRIERYTSQAIPVHTITGLEPRFAGKMRERTSAERKPGDGARRGGKPYGKSASQPGSGWSGHEGRRGGAGPRGDFAGKSGFASRTGPKRRADA